MKKMRRTDRMLSNKEAMDVLREGEYGILSTVDGEGQPYGVPVNYVVKDNSVYFHATNEGGYKYDNILNDEKVSFTVVIDAKVLSDQFASLYRSAIVFGKAHIVGDEQERLSVFNEFLNKYSPDYIAEGKKYLEKAKAKAVVLKISIDTVTGKGRTKE